MNTTSSNGVKETRPPATSARRRHTPAGVGLGRGASPEAQRLAAAVLEVLAGVRTPRQAAEALGIALPRYFQWETRAIQALVGACEPRPRGRVRNADKELSAVKKQYERLQRELTRQQTLVRLAQRTVGLTPPKAAHPAGGKDKKKRVRRPAIRAYRAAQALHQLSQETRDPPSPEATPATGTPHHAHGAEG